MFHTYVDVSWFAADVSWFVVGLRGGDSWLSINERTFLLLFKIQNRQIKLLDSTDLHCDFRCHLVLLMYTCERVDELWMFRWGYIYSEHSFMTHRLVYSKKKVALVLSPGQIRKLIVVETFVILDVSSNVSMFAHPWKHCCGNKICFPRSKNVSYQFQKHLRFPYVSHQCFL